MPCFFLVGGCKVLAHMRQPRRRNTVLRTHYDECDPHLYRSSLGLTADRNFRQSRNHRHRFGTIDRFTVSTVVLNVSRLSWIFPIVDVLCPFALATEPAP
jgi:hypothetical protein